MATLVLVRHGQSLWNLQNRFTGWIDVPLTEKGTEEAKKAGQLLKKYSFNIAFTSTLIRAQATLLAIFSENPTTQFRFVHPSSDNEWYSHLAPSDEDKKTLNVYYDAALNERYYGDLQGLNKDETKKKYGDEQVKIWRRSFNICPPNGESLELCAKRSIPYYTKNIEKELKKGKNVLVVAHGNSLRSIIMHIEKMTPEQILEFELATGVPRVYEFDSKMKMISVRNLE